MDIPNSVAIDVVTILGIFPYTLAYFRMPRDNQLNCWKNWLLLYFQEVRENTEIWFEVHRSISN